MNKLQLILINKMTNEQFVNLTESLFNDYGLSQHPTDVTICVEDYTNFIQYLKHPKMPNEKVMSFCNQMHTSLLANIVMLGYDERDALWWTTADKVLDEKSKKRWMGIDE